MATWALYPTMAGVGGALFAGDQVTIGADGTMVFASYISGALTTHHVVPAHSFAYAVLAGYTPAAEAANDEDEDEDEDGDGAVPTITQPQVQAT